MKRELVALIVFLPSCGVLCLFHAVPLVGLELWQFLFINVFGCIESVKKIIKHAKSIYLSAFDSENKKHFTLQSVLPQPIPRNFVESDLGSTLISRVIT